MTFAAGSPVQRSELIDLCWSDRAAAQGQASLRQALHEIRTDLRNHADTLLTVDRSTVLLRMDQIECDLWGKDGAIRRDATGVVLQGLDPVAPVFDEWLQDKRRELETKFLAEAERYLAGIENSSAPEALRAAERVLQLDPCNEVASRRAMSIHAEQGRLSQVQTVFSYLSDALSDLGFEVSAKTVEHFNALRRPNGATTAGQGEPVARFEAKPVGASSGAPTLYIEKFRIEIADVHGHLDAYIQEVIVDRLALLQELRVKFKDGQSAGDYVMSGSVRPGTDERLMFSLRIADNHDGTSVWSSRSELPLAPTPAHIEDCVADIAADIISSIERKELERRENRGMNAGNAYDLYLQSKRLFFGAIEDAYVDRVVDLLEQAIAASPMFAPAYDHLIQIYNTGMFFSRVGMDMTQPRKRAMQLAQNLLSINAKNPHAHIAMAWCQIWRKNFMAAERAIDTAIGLRPYEAHRLNSVATALVYLGRLDEAEEYYGQALRRMGNDMDYQRTDIGELHYLKRDFDQALSWLESGESRARYRTLFWRIPTYAQLGRLDEAGRDIEELDEEFRRRWHGNGDYNRKDGIRWYLDFKVMKRNIDRDILLDGLAKAGLLS